MSTQLTILPGIVFPKEDELLSSWIYRLAEKNYTKSHSFTQFHFKGFEIWNRDIDKLAGPEFYKKASFITTIPEESIANLSLKSYEGYLFEYCNAFGLQRWILPLKIFHRTRLRNGLQFCPGCLSKNRDEPYFRKSWRLSISICCTSCQTLLHDCCPFCQKPICFFRNELGAKTNYASTPINHCSHCKNNLCHSPKFPARIGAVSYQIKLNRFIADGHTKAQQYSIQYFEVLYQMTKLLCTRNPKLKRFQMLVLGCCSNDLLSNSHIRREFEHFSIFERESILPSAMWLLEQWPRRFLDLCEKARVSSAYIYKDFKIIPYWFKSVVDKERFNPVY